MRYPWEKIDLLCDTTKIPFKSEIFDSASFIASFNHIPQEKVAYVLRETYRVLKKGGLLLITNTSPFVGYINHEIFHKFDDIDRGRRGIHKGEVLGYTHKELLSIITKDNLFVYIRRVPFLYHLSYLYIFKKEI